MAKHKHRDWTEWGKRKAVFWQRQREIAAMLDPAQMLGAIEGELLFNQPNFLFSRLRSNGKTHPFNGGEEMRISIQYGEK